MDKRKRIKLDRNERKIEKSIPKNFDFSNVLDDDIKEFVKAAKAYVKEVGDIKITL